MEVSEIMERPNKAGKCRLDLMEYRDEDLIIKVKFRWKDEILLPEATTINLMFVERATDEALSFPLVKIDQEDQLLFYECELKRSSYIDEFKNGLFWDLYVTIEDNVGMERHRLRGNKVDLDLFYSVVENTYQMIIPYKTNKKNVSFKIKEALTIAIAEEAHLQKDGMLTIKGYADNPIFNVISTDNYKKYLVVRSKNKDKLNEEANEEYYYDMQQVERKDLTEIYGHLNQKYDWAGFKVSVDLKELNYQLEQDESFRYLFDIKIRQDNGGDSVESIPVKLKYKKKFPTQSTVLKLDGIKKRLTLKRNKKRENLSFSVSLYDFKKEMRAKVLRNLLKIKRSTYTKKTYKFIFRLIGKMPTNKRLIMFESFLGKQYSDNPRAIYEYLLENHPEYKMVWSADKKYVHHFERRNVPYAKRFSVKWLFLMAGARYWVSNSRLPLWIPKPGNTTYLQTWHGTPLKRLAADMDQVHMPGTSTEKYKRNFHKESSHWDYLISPNAYSSEIFKRAFAFNKTMIESGYPRNDFLYLYSNQASVDKFKEDFGLPLNKKVILYAPTWRDDQFHGKGRYKFDLDLDLNLMREKLGDDYIVILRMHYLVAENLDLSPYEGFAYDYSNHEDIRELYLIADLLITDYSSVFFDYANLRRPMIFYVYDIDNYRDKLRGFYFDFEAEAPGPLVKTTEEVIESIKENERNDFQAPPSFEEFYDRFCYLEDGKASERVVNEVFLGRTRR